MAKDPAFLFYSSDFMMGTLLLTMEERGQFITLLSVMHQQGRLSQEEVEVVIRGKASEKLKAKFKVDDSGLWYNERLEVETSKRKKFTDSRRNSLDIDNDDQVHIYILSDPGSGNFKIGSSKYPLLRLGEMQKKSPAVTMYWKSELLVPRSVEKQLHLIYKDQRVKNDWFALTPDDIESIISSKFFRTESINNSRTDSRTENENRNRNENANVTEGKGVQGEAYTMTVKIPEKQMVSNDTYQDAVWWTEQLISGNDVVTLEMIRKRGVDLKGSLEQLARDHLDLCSKYKWHLKWKDDVTAFRHSVVKHIIENINKNFNGKSGSKNNTEPAASTIIQPGKGFGNIREHRTNRRGSSTGS